MSGRVDPITEAGSVGVKSVVTVSLMIWSTLGVLGPAGVPGSAGAQTVDSEVREAYFRAVSEHFQVSLDEVSIIGEWDLAADEVPVVLFLAEAAGVSPDVLIGMRRAGRPWQEVGRRFAIQNRSYYLTLPAEGDKGPLTQVYDTFRTRPVGEWSQIRLEDTEVVALVNLRVLSDQARVPPLRVLACYMEAGSFVACYPRLLSGPGV